MDWNPEQYEKFIAAREQPFVDLLARIDKRPHQRAVDLGCGPGTLTRKLADALPASDVTGLDSSAAMLARAGTLARPGLQFVQASIEAWADEAGEPYDLVFSNAALQWVPGHQTLVPKLVARLAAGGQIVVQLPADDYNPMRAVFADVAGWRHQMATLDITAYAELLYRAGLDDLDVFEKVYPHVLPDADAVLEWARGTALLPYLERLPPAQHGPYLDEVRKRLHACYPTRPVFFPFRRVVFCARRA